MKDRFQNVSEGNAACAAAIKPNLDVQFLFMDKTFRYGSVSFFAFSCGFSGSVIQLMSLKVEKFDILVLTSKHRAENQNTP